MDVSFNDTRASLQAQSGSDFTCRRHPAARRVSKQAALFCKKARKKLHSPCNLGRAERAESPNPQGAARRHEVFLLLFVHKKKTFLASLRWASPRSATRANFLLLFSKRKPYFLL
jgi:hypothetical protein